MTDILFINPPFGNQQMNVTLPFSMGGKNKQTDVKSLYGRIATPPLGLMYMAAYLREYRIDSAILDLRLEPMSLDGFTRFLQEEKPRVVGIHTLTEMYGNCLAIARAVKEWDPSAIVIMGGAHVTFIDKEPVETGLVDIVVRGEGEETMLELARLLLDRDNSTNVNLGDVRGITYRDGTNEKTICRNEPRIPISDLDALPLPARDMIDLDKYFRAGLMISSRGCPYRCVFCSVPAMTEGKYRHRAVDAVVDEMFYLSKDLGFPMVSMVDDTVSAYPGRLEKICRALIEKKFDAEWTCQLRINEVSPELLKLMKDSGCTHLQFGIESGDDKVLKAVRKGITLERMEQAMKWTHEMGINIKCSAMIGHHADTPESISNTIDLLAKFKDQYNARASIGINTPLPGTYIYNHAEELGIKILSDQWSDFIVGRAVIETAHLSRFELQQWYSRGVLKTTSMDAQAIINRMAGPMGNLDEDTVVRLMASNTLKVPPYGGGLTPWIKEEAA